MHEQPVGTQEGRREHRRGGKKRDRKEGGKEGKKEERKEGAELVSDRGEERRRGGGLFCRGGRGGSGGVSYK